MRTDTIVDGPWSDEAEADATLVARARSGDQEAFGALYERYWRRIRALAWRFTHSDADADDLAQDVFLKAYVALPRFRGQCRFYSWLYQIARNAGINHRTRRMDTEDLDDAEPVSELGPEEHCIAQQRLTRVEAAIDGLTGPLRQALVLNTVRGFEYADVSRLGECPLGTARSRIFRARQLVTKAAEAG